MITQQCFFQFLVSKDPKINLLNNVYIGEEAVNKKGLMDVYNIISKGKIVNFDHYEKLHTFENELRTDPTKYPFFQAEQTGIEMNQRVKLSEILFEKFNIPSYGVQNDSYACLAATGKTTGTVVNIGEECSSVTTIYNGELLSHASILGSISGKQITEYLGKFVKIEHQNPRSITWILNEMKENLCFVALDYEKELKNIESMSYQTPFIQKLNYNKKGSRFLSFYLSLNFLMKNHYIIKSSLQSISVIHSFILLFMRI